AVEVPEGKTLFITEDPFEAYLKLTEHFRPFQPASKMISDSAVIGRNTVIMPNVFIGNNVVIGHDCLIHPNVSIYDHSILGNHVIIHAGATIGSDAYYYNTKKNRDHWFKKMKSSGVVRIEDF